MSGKTLADLRALAPDLARAAQDEIDPWHQDENGVDEVLGTGGCCGLVADAMCGVLAGEGFDIARMGTDFDGGHEFLAVNIAEGVFTVDVPARVYETGSGYVWKKIEGAVVAPEDVAIDKVAEPMSDRDFGYRYADDPEPSGP